MKEYISIIVILIILIIFMIPNLVYNLFQSILGRFILFMLLIILISFNNFVGFIFSAFLLIFYSEIITHSYPILTISNIDSYYNKYTLLENIDLYLMNSLRSLFSSLLL